MHNVHVHVCVNMHILYMYMYMKVQVYSTLQHVVAEEERKEGNPDPTNMYMMFDIA